MEPVEINAGRWYLRALRCESPVSGPVSGGTSPLRRSDAGPPGAPWRIDDRAAVLASSQDPEINRWRHRPHADLADAEAYIRRRAGEWVRDERYTWAVCEPTTGEMLGEIELTDLDLCHGTTEVACWALPAARGRGMTSTALSAVVRFAFGGLGLHRVTYAWADGNTASARVAERCGFQVEGLQRSAWVVDGRRVDVHIAGRLATEELTIDHTAS